MVCYNQVFAELTDSKQRQNTAEQCENITKFSFTGLMHMPSLLKSTLDRYRVSFFCNKESWTSQMVMEQTENNSK